MEQHRIADLDDWARAHHGIVSMEATGWSRSAWYRAITAGRLIQVHPRVARLPGTTVTAEQRIIAATMAVPGAVASHRSAARLWGIPRPDGEMVDLIDQREGCQTALDGVVIHRPTDRRRLEPQRRFGIRCTNILRTLVDLGAVDTQGVIDAVGCAIAAALVDLDALEATVRQHSQHGRPGVPALRAAIDEWSIDSKPADSVLEPAMRRLVTRHRLPPVEFHPAIEGYEVDFRVTGTPLLLECDGWTFHGLDRQRFERDRRRDADLAAAGWVVIRFTYRSITATPAAVARRIRAVVERWSPHPSPDVT